MAGFVQFLTLVGSTWTVRIGLTLDRMVMSYSLGARNGRSFSIAGNAGGTTEHSELI